MGPLFKNIIPDYKVASAYSCGRNKTTATLDEADSSNRHNFIEHCRSHPFSPGADGTNDTGVSKMNPLSIRITYINNTSRTGTNHFYMCLTEGVDGAKASSIITSTEEKFTKDG